MAEQRVGADLFQIASDLTPILAVGKNFDELAHLDWRVLEVKGVHPKVELLVELRLFAFQAVNMGEVEVVTALRDVVVVTDLVHLDALVVVLLAHPFPESIVDMLSDSRLFGLPALPFALR